MALIDPAKQGRAAPPRHNNRHLYTDADPIDLVPFADKVNLCQTIDAAARARDPRVAPPQPPARHQIGPTSRRSWNNAFAICFFTPFTLIFISVAISA